MGFIDIHSHILPCVDDGAKTIDDSIDLLRQEKENDVTSVVLTPHFYPDYDTFDDHYNHILTAFNTLKKECEGKDLPDIYLGSEVQYFTGISRCEILDKMCISGTNYLLLELPFLTPITPTMLEEVKRIDRDLGITVIIAHIERYCNDRLFKKLIDLVKNGDIKAQINADSVFHPVFHKPILKLLKKGIISYIASDTHSVKERPVLIKDSISFLKQKYYPQVIQCLKNSEKLEQLLKG
jgi:protein-tyrosine phosphatase